MLQPKRSTIATTTPKAKIPAMMYPASAPSFSSCFSSLIRPASTRLDAKNAPDEVAFLTPGAGGTVRRARGGTPDAERAAEAPPPAERGQGRSPGRCRLPPVADGRRAARARPHPAAEQRSGRRDAVVAVLRRDRPQQAAGDHHDDAAHQYCVQDHKSDAHLVLLVRFVK